jgi:hypothetical protein
VVAVQEGNLRVLVEEQVDTCIILRNFSYQVLILLLWVQAGLLVE